METLLSYHLLCKEQAYRISQFSIIVFLNRCAFARLILYYAFLQKSTETLKFQYFWDSVDIYTAFATILHICIPDYSQGFTFPL